MCWNSTEELYKMYRRVKKNARKAVSKAMREKAEEVLAKLNNFPYGMFRQAKVLKFGCAEVEGGSDGRLYFGEKERGLY